MEKVDKTNRFLEMLEQHKGILFKVAKAYASQQEDREDIIQEISFQLWRSFDSYSPQYRYSTWVYRISLNVAISFYRKHTVRQKHQTEFVSQLIEFEEADLPPENEAVQLLRQFISELRKLDKALILLYLDAKSQKEMAEILGISETNVSTRINRIKKILLNRFNNVK